MTSPAEKFLKHVANVVAERSAQYGDAAGNMTAIAGRWSATLGREVIHEIRSRVGMLELDMAKIDQPAITRHFDAIEGKIDKLHDFLLERLTQMPR